MPANSTRLGLSLPIGGVHGGLESRYRQKKEVISMLTRLRRWLVRKLDPVYYRAALRLAAVDVAIDLHLLLDLRMVGRDKFYEIVAQAADETYGDYERVMSRTEKLEELIARSDKPTYEERVDEAIRLVSVSLSGLLVAAHT